MFSLVRIKLVCILPISHSKGKSLMFDIPPHPMYTAIKICGHNCAYCQLGRTRPVIGEQRGFLFHREAILVQVLATLDARKPGEIDCVTSSQSPPYFAP
jgi:wyosine [tRNA(Phe)-imidazoG37] synthetase (radical SAM superfamily)